MRSTRLWLTTFRTDVIGGRGRFQTCPYGDGWWMVTVRAVTRVAPTMAPLPTAFPCHSREGGNPDGWCWVYEPPASRYARRVPFCCAKRGEKRVFCAKGDGSARRRTPLDSRLRGNDGGFGNDGGLVGVGAVREPPLRNRKGNERWWIRRRRLGC